MNLKFILFLMLMIITAASVLIQILRFIESCINYLRKPANEEAPETQTTAAAAAANGVEFATLQEIRIVSGDDYGGLVYDACSSSTGTTTQESSTGEVGGGDSCCAICIEEYAVGERRATVAPCNHRFHASCVEAWLAKEHTCPLCRQTVD